MRSYPLVIVWCTGIISPCLWGQRWWGGSGADIASITHRPMPLVKASPFHAQVGSLPYPRRLAYELPSYHPIFSADSQWLPKPRVSGLLSALLPGAGQIYNRSYWKAPIVWGALGITGYLAYRNHQAYLFYRRAYQDALAGGDPLPPLRPENIRALRESYRQDRDVFGLAFLLLYGLQIGEAYADAHLKGFVIYSGLSPTGACLAVAW